MKTKPHLLILSFSNLIGDARLLKQIRAFAADYHVTTCGYGPPPIEDVEHLELQKDIPKSIELMQAVCLRTRDYRAAYWLTPYVRHAKRLLKGRVFDVVLANDLDTVGLALSVADGRRVHLDLHEFWPGIHDDVVAWTKLRAPYYSWQLHAWARNVRSATTINKPLAERYEKDYGLRCGVVTNASEFRDLKPGVVTRPLRLVHSGGAQPNRKIERMMRAVASSDTGATLDLYLVGDGTEYYRSLESLAGKLGSRVRILPPVTHASLVDTLNDYDVGLPFLPPTTTNIRMTLPNKFFDYVQARLAILTGPTAPMVEILEEYDLGVVTDDFSEEALTRAIDDLDEFRVTEWKQHTNRAATELAGERQNSGWLRAIQNIVETKD